MEDDVRLTKEQRKAQILNEASRIFVKNGYHATKTREIAKACSVSEPVIYKHFKSKEELFLEVISSIAGTTFNEISFDVDADTEYILSSFVMNRVEVVENYFPIFKRLIVELLESEEIRRYYFDRFFPKLAGPVMSYLDQLKEQKHIKKETSSKVSALMLAGILLMTSFAKYLERESAFSDMSEKELASQMLNMLLYGILSEKNEGDSYGS